jgi:hypothetical protein
MDPVLGIFARGFAARQATTNPRKPIVVIGVWLWIGPVVALTLMMASMSLSELLRTVGDRRWLAASGAAMGLIASSAIVAITFTILLRTTDAYFRQRHHVTEQPAESSENGLDEPMKCLACGQTMTQDTNVCNACGWSFSADD